MLQILPLILSFLQLALEVTVMEPAPPSEPMFRELGVMDVAGEVPLWVTENVALPMLICPDRLVVLLSVRASTEYVTVPLPLPEAPAVT